MERIHKILSDNWALRRQEYENLAALLLSSMANGNLEGITALLGTGYPEARLLQPQAQTPAITKTWNVLFDDDIPVGSILLVPLTGMLYSWETSMLVELIKKADANPNISGLLLKIDGPGGMSSHVERLARAIREFSKPSATVVTNLMASAHFWIGTATDRIFVASPLCEVGSVGAFLTYVSFLEYYRKNGIDYREIYPDTADLKNKASRAVAESGDESLFKERLEKLHKAFASDVELQVGIPYDPALPLYRGETFSGAEALEMGIAQAEGDVEDALEWISLQISIAEANSFFAR